MNTDGKGGGEEWRKIERGETFMKIYCMRKKSVFNKRWQSRDFENLNVGEDCCEVLTAGHDIAIECLNSEYICL